MSSRSIFSFWDRHARHLEDGAYIQRRIKIPCFFYLDEWQLTSVDRAEHTHRCLAQELPTNYGVTDFAR